MRKGNLLWLCIATTLILTNVVMSQDPDRNPDERQRKAELRERRERRGRAGQERLKTFIMERLDSLLQQVGESIGQRYELEETTVNQLRRAVRESVENQLNQESQMGLLFRPVHQRDMMRSFVGAARDGGMQMLEMLLSQPNCRAALAKHLNGKQFQDYLDFLKARGQREQRAVNRQLTALIDQQLSLTSNQREKVEQMLVTETSDGWPSMDTLTMTSKEAINLVHQNHTGQIDGIFSQKQSKIWQRLVTPSKDGETEWRAKDENDLKARFHKAEVEIAEAVKAGRITKKQADERLEALRRRLGAEEDDDLDEDEHRIQFRKAEAEITEAVKAGRITKKQADERLEALRRRLRAEERNQRDPTIMKENENASQNTAKLIAEAQLAAHTEQLGPLDERASRRLALVSKGVVEQFLETQDEWKDPTSSDDITNHPLYQQTIEDVLSEDTFDQYKAYQEERLAFRQKVSRDLVVASLDRHLLLGENQRKHLEVITGMVNMWQPAPIASGKTLTPVHTLIQLSEQLNSEALSPWQWERFSPIIEEFQEWTSNNDVNRRR
ncbi:TPA: hypothetical protein EYN98_24990 [Candidatus Poribacteria bacterium]|nr:hypothetical protein [Candidatus Poribacteria bacterium]